MIVDDDAMTREVLCLLAADAGFDCAAFESGEAALAALEGMAPDVVLTDLQLPGVAGDSLARLLRAGSGPATVILAMSGTAVPPEQTEAFDAFLLKPFSMEEMSGAIERLASAPRAEPGPGILSESIYAAFQKSMTRDQLRQLYAMSLDDADARIAQMRLALNAGDGDAYRRAAHSVKGGCGMVGALELARMAARMEEDGWQIVDGSVPPLQMLDEFLSASARLRRILDAR
jgi:CheY-like chemotaxis protein/HPt (histidine-containing phosphotransfer) domain-containing protein